jgi:putative toxin-antitoxin system antitoxin component (TIGR02293 family)
MGISLIRATWHGLVVGFQMEVKVLSSIKEYQPEPQTPQSIWMTLGLPSRGTRLHDLVREGLPFEYLERIASLLQVRHGVISKAIFMSHTTVARRQRAGRFNAEEEALSLFDNDVATAMEWLSSPVRGLGAQRPIDMLGTRVETKAVFDLIGQLEKGVLV